MDCEFRGICRFFNEKSNPCLNNGNGCGAKNRYLRGGLPNLKKKSLPKLKKIIDKTKPEKKEESLTPSSLPENVIIHGDCIEVLKDFPENSIDCVITDPPYGLNFMGKDWDKALPPRTAFVEMCRVLKPGALAFVMSSPRQDLMWRMAQLLEESGFELGQSFISWVYNTGFPKAFDVASNISKRIGNFISKSIDNYNSWEDANSINPSRIARIVEKLYLKNLIETGINTTSKNIVADDVSHYLSQRKLNVNVSIVEKSLCEVQLRLEENIFFVVENVDTIQQPLNSSVKIVELNLREQDQILAAKLIFVPLNAQTFFTQRTQELIIKVEEAQRIERGEKRFWNETDIDALIVEVLNDFRHTISNQLRNILNLGMMSQMELLTATNVIITETIKECLTSVMENILVKGKVIGINPNSRPNSDSSSTLYDLGFRKEKGSLSYITEPASDEAKRWEGWKSVTGLKPAIEIIFMVQKPLSEKTIVDNVLRWGTGAMNVNACRIPTTSDEELKENVRGTDFFDRPSLPSGYVSVPSERGRFPANLCCGSAIDVDIDALLEARRILNEKS